MKTITVEEIKALDIKDKILVIRSDNFNASAMEGIRKGLFEKGCLGIMALPSDGTVQSLGLKQLEDMVKQIKERQEYEKESKGSTNDTN